MNNKKFLYITHLSGKRMNRIWLSSIKAAKQLGYEVHLACNMAEAEHPGWDQDCVNLGLYTHQIDFIRNPFSLKNEKARKQLSELMKQEKFEIVHCNTPIGGILGRICAKHNKVPYIIYQAHGFHFWKGAPIKNWLLYYPVERWLSGYTDMLITITKDDYALAQKMKAKEVAYVHGIGIDLEQFSRKDRDDNNLPLRQKLGIPENARVLLSVGELNSNKNHRVVFEAIKMLKRDDIHYVICGEGDQRTVYEQYIQKQKLAEKIHLMGFQHNIREYDRMADLFVFPSLREGIPGAIMEAIATGIPVITSDIRGIRDIIQDEKYRFDPKSAEQIAKKISWAFQNNHDQAVKKNANAIMPYSFDAVVEELSKIYGKQKDADN